MRAASGSIGPTPGRLTAPGEVLPGPAHLQHGREVDALGLAEGRARGDGLDRDQLRELVLAGTAAQERELGVGLHQTDGAEEVARRDDVEPVAARVAHLLADVRILEPDARTREPDLVQVRADRGDGIERAPAGPGRIVDGIADKVAVLERDRMARDQRLHAAVTAYLGNPARVLGAGPLEVDVDGEHRGGGVAVARDHRGGDPGE